MFLRTAFALFLLNISGIAAAAATSIDVRGPDGRPLAGAVVAIAPARPVANPPRGPYAMEQRDIQFQPHVLIVPVGATVAFPNRDRVRHHVYSFSKPRKFDLKLYGRDETRSIVFDKPGVVALGCNIHDAMSAFVYVATTPFVAQTDAAGHVAIADVPAGSATLTIWHPSIRAQGNAQVQPIAIRGNAAALSVAIRR